MKLRIAILLLSGVGYGLGAALLSTDDGPTPAKVESLEPKYFKDLGAKRVKITYGPYVVPGNADPETHGMKLFQDMNAMMPCHECLITQYTADLQFINGTSANANKNMWLHHIGLMNLHRTDAACEEWPERMSINGNERSPVDMTIKGTRKAGYYLRKDDQILLSTDAMNLHPQAQTVTLVMEWEYIPGTPDDFDIAVPVWLDLRGACLNESRGARESDLVFDAKTTSPWISQFAGDLILMVPHIHDGNTKQEVYLNGKLVCRNVPGYGETSGYITHLEGTGEHHDHGKDSHVLHVSSVSQCRNVGKVVPGDKFSLTSFYNMTEHTPMMNHDGSFETIMGIEFLHFARPRDEVVKEILAMKPGSLQSFLDWVTELDAQPPVFPLHS
ncbi:hypothetical protein B0H63DRAFT_450449 [Podospora didyma]|uniref:Uncharacterized protein n=1 Tax=Podospora didyma TaxID=330526 RepID=A0AAE0NGG0_9PEZI|nr:hypothetical protein B0H63DRAFT_450449 [Podospora didyma]